MANGNGDDVTPPGEQQTLFGPGTATSPPSGPTKLWKTPQGQGEQMRLGQRPPGKIAQFAHRLNTGQFSPQDQKLVGATQNILNTVQRTQEFRRAGIGAAVRYTLGMPQMAPGVQELARARLYRRGETYHPAIIGQPHGGYGEAPEGPED